MDEALQLSVDLSAEIIAGVDTADIMLARDGEIAIPVSTDEVAVQVDEAQKEADEGPCLTILRDDVTRVVMHDLEQDDRWPDFRSRALDLGIRSAVAYRITHTRGDGRTLGALNLFGFEPHRDELALDLGQVFATHCSTVLSAEIDREGLQAALQSRDVIGQAKGILMERHGVTAERAFELLRTASNQRNTKLRDLAD